MVLLLGELRPWQTNAMRRFLETGAGRRQLGQSKITESAFVNQPVEFVNVEIPDADLGELIRVVADNEFIVVAIKQ